MESFRNMLFRVDRSYDGFVHAVITYVKTPGNEGKQKMIEEYICGHPDANSSDVLKFMVEKTGFDISSARNERIEVVKD